MIIGRSKFFKVNKIARGVSAICSLSEICKCSLHQIAREIMLLLVNNVHKKHQSQDRRNFESERVLFVICTRVTRECIYFQPIRTCVSPLAGRFETSQGKVCRDFGSKLYRLLI